MLPVNFSTMLNIKLASHTLSCYFCIDNSLLMGIHILLYLLVSFPRFRVHLKHCSSDHNTSRDLEFDKNVPRLVTTGAINLKKKQSEGNTL